MYICMDCGCVFYEPHQLIIPDTCEYGRVVEETCPSCGGERFQEADSCPDCTGWKVETDKLCPICKEELRDRFKTFVETLTEAQEEELDDMLDGCSIKEI